MRGLYDDITSRIVEDPSWYDEFGVPRYGAFHPLTTGNIYKHEAALAEVVCQECLRSFIVCCAGWHGSLERKLKELPGWIYGDPPAHRGDDLQCAAGDSMQALTVRVIEFWRWTHQGSWLRDQTLEVTVEWNEEEAERIRRAKWTATKDNRRAPWFNRE